MRLLIAEDNYLVRKMIRTTVANAEDEIIECSNGNDAVNAYSDFRPDWVLMDYEMPGMDGISATKEILKIDPLASVLVVSQYNDIDINEAAEQAGAKFFISKENMWAINRMIR